MVDCGSQLSFRNYYTLPDSPRKLSGGIFCRQNHLCTLCSAFRAVRALSTAVPKTLARLAERPDLRPAMLTITCRNRSDLRAMLEELYGAQSRWIEKRRNAIKSKGRKTRTILTQVDGYIGSGEVKRGAGSGEWHLHAHGVCFVPPGLTKHDFYPEWSKLLGYEANLDFRYLRSSKLLDEGKPVSSIVEEVGAELMEVFKYALKTADLGHADRVEAWRVLHGRRMVRSFGSMHGYVPPEEFTDDLSGLDELPYWEIVYRFVNGWYEKHWEHHSANAQRWNYSTAQKEDCLYESTTTGFLADRRASAGEGTGSVLGCPAA